MPVPLLVPILGAMAGTMAGPALGLGAAAAAGGAAAGGIGGLLASAAPAAIGSGIATLAAGGDPREALMNAALAGTGSAAMPGITQALQGAAGAGAQQAAAEAVRTPVQAASAAPATSLRPMVRPEGLTSGASAANPVANLGVKDLAQLYQMSGAGGPQQQTAGAAPAPAPQISAGQPQAAGGSAFGNILASQPQATPTAADYTGGQPLPAIASADGESMMPDSLNVGLGMLRPQQQQQDMMPNNMMMRGFA